MRALHSLLDEMADRPAPPTRLNADDLFTAGRRRHRRLRAVQAAAAFTVSALLLSGVGVLVRSLDRADRPPPALPVAGDSPSHTPVGDRQVSVTTAADAQHLYVARPACPDGSCKLRSQLEGSTDGGHSWTRRGPVRELTDLAAIGPETLLGLRPAAAGNPVIISLDGGRTFAPLRTATTPVTQVPPGSAFVCLPTTAGATCLPYAVDPVDGDAAPLAHRPSLVMSDRIGSALGRHVAAGVLWTVGNDPATGAPAAAVSTDFGRSWRTHTFADPACADGCRPPDLTLGEGTTAYAIVGTNKPRVFRHSGADTWTGTGALAQVPGRGGAAWSFVAQDGTHIVAQIRATGRSYIAASADGYAPTQVRGLPEEVQPVQRTRDGWFFTFDSATGVGYGSTDGRQWRALS